MDKPFRPKLGRLHQTPVTRSLRYGRRLMRAAWAIGKPVSGGHDSGKQKLKSLRGGRGSGASYRHGFARHKTRRVIVKIRSVKMGNGAKGTITAGGAKAHLRYLQRDSAARNIAQEMSNSTNKPTLSPDYDGGLYNDTAEGVDDTVVLRRIEQDRHHFRVIISPEEATDLASMKDYIRDLMRGVEQDLNTKLDWVAVNHFNTGYPHSHLVIRGTDDKGNDLVMARDYITHGLRARAGRHLEMELGPRSERDIADALRREVGQQRFTSLDRDLIYLSRGNEVSVHRGQSTYDRFRHGLLTRRLRVLEQMGLASIISGQHRLSVQDNWLLEARMEPSLRALGREGDIIRTMAQQSEPARGRRIFKPGNPSQKPLLGEVIDVGLNDDMYDGVYMILSATDGRHHYIDLGKQISGTLPTKGNIVGISSPDHKPRASDLSIVRVAQTQQGVYSSAAHFAYDGPHQTAYLTAHKRRLEAMRRKGLVQRLPNGDWLIPRNYLARVQQLDPGKPLIDIKSWVPLAGLSNVASRNWLDDLVSDPFKDRTMQGFGYRLQEAIRERRLWLRSHKLAVSKQTGFALMADALEGMTQSYLAKTGKRLAASMSKSYQPVIEDRAVTGRFIKALSLPNGKYAVLESATSLSLMRWKPMLEKYRGQQVTAVMRGKNINWSVAQSRER